MGSQKIPNLDEVENLAGGGICFIVPDAFAPSLKFSNKILYIAWFKPEYSKSYVLHVSPTLLPIIFIGSFEDID